MLIDVAREDDHWMAEGWRWHLSQCATIAAVTEAEQRLHATLERNRSRDRSVAWIRDALRACADRRNEIAAAAAMRPGASGVL